MAVQRDGTALDDRLAGGSKKDRLDGKGGDDALNGNGGGDVMLGGRGNDRMEGRGGGDRMNGGAGDDRLSGGAGRDRIKGGAGDDAMTGGGGRDVFVLTRGGRQRDEIAVFGPRDRIEFESGVKGFDRLKILDRGEDVVVRYGRDEILLKDVERRDIGVEDFLFD
ncbi:MAG: calcium-binding protein [Pseudomonadota bacterium]